jgi:hypothetical protein
MNWKIYWAIVLGYVLIRIIFWPRHFAGPRRGQRE